MSNDVDYRGLGYLPMDGCLHRISNPHCPECGPDRCPCGGLIHLQWVYGPAPVHQCDLCGSYDPPLPEDEWPEERRGLEFEPTIEGAAAATVWLEDTGQIDLLQKEQSTDGWTLVALANSLRKRERKA